MRTAVVTASYINDFDRCRLMCESMDQRLKGDWHHYILVTSSDVALFRALEGPRRQVIDERDLLPSWLVSMPDPISVGRRRMWVNPYSLPLRGWHVQQLRRLALARFIDEPVMFAVDSDVVFLRDFNPADLWLGDRLALYRIDGGVGEVMNSNHLEWLSHSDRLLGIGPYTLPAHDYISTLIAWRSDTCRALLDHIEGLHGRNWVRAMVRSRQFSECMIYGRFVDEVLMGAGHRASAQGLCHILWIDGDYPRDIGGIRSFMRGMEPHQIGIGLQSFIGHDLDDIRHLVMEAAA